MKTLAKPAWERFATCYALSGNAAESYRRCGAKGKHGRDAGKRGAEYRNKPEIQNRIMELRREIETEAAGEFKMCKAELLRWLSGAIRMTVAQANASSPFVQHFNQTRTARRSCVRISFVDKMRAAAMLASLSGWNRQESPALPLAPQTAAPVDSNQLAERLALAFTSNLPETGSVPGEKSSRQVPVMPRRANRPSVLCLGNPSMRFEACS